MLKTIQTIFAFSACLMFNINTVADIYSDINKCANIESSLKRLHCFDSVSKNYKQITSQSLSTEQESTTQLNIDPKNDNNSKQQPSAQLKSTPTTQSDEATFGKDIIEVENSLEAFESEIIGSFSGWKKGMKLHLKNGQIWKVVKKGTGFKKMMNPKITISRGIFETYNAKVEGISSIVKVKRIK